MLDTKIGYWLRRIFSEIWLRILGFCLLSVATAVLANLLSPLIPASWAGKLGSDAVEPVLNILASSMLTVSTFSLGIMASAVAGAAQGASPRTTQLLLDDQTSQNVIATFMGAFVFSLVGIICLKIGIYDGSGRIILMLMTIVILVIIFISFVRWIDLLRTFGRINDTLKRLENAITSAIDKRIASPCLGCHIWDGQLPEQENGEELTPIYAETAGYVQHIDLAQLNQLAEENNLDIYIICDPGSFTTMRKPLLRINGEISDELAEKLRNCFVLGIERDYRQDVRFGFIIMAESASRALSPGINDPGTAIDILRRAQRLLLKWVRAEKTYREEKGEPEISYSHLWLTPLGTDIIYKDLIRPIARDGAGNVEVQIAIQKTLLELAYANPEFMLDSTQKASRDALSRAEKSLNMAEDVHIIRHIAGDLTQFAVDYQHKESAPQS